MTGSTRLIRTAFALVLALGALAAGSPAVASADKVLVLDTTVSGGASSIEGAKAASLGYEVDVVDSTAWGALTASDFASYRAIILGDPTCGSLGAAAAAEANASVWGPQVDGNVVLVGTDPVFHQSQGGRTLTENGVAFAADEPGKTGAYITLSCYYHDTAPGTPVPLLSGLSTQGGFTATGVGCFNDSHITATHPALASLTDADLSNWSCSVHEAFDGWPSDFVALAIAEGAGGSYTAPDGSVGTPYILARGEGVVVISDITLEPGSATNEVGQSHTVTATVKTDGAPVVGTTVTFEIVSGPHAGRTGTGVSDADGKATFMYTGTAEGTDSIVATFVDSESRTQRSNSVTKEWTKPSNNPPSCAGVGPDVKQLWPPNHKLRLITLRGGSDPDGDPVSLTVTTVTQDEALDGAGDGSTKPDATRGPAAHQVHVRSERSGNGDGRVYRISFTGSDGRGGECTGTTKVTVPHDQGKKGGAVDSGLTVNSFGS